MNFQTIISILLIPALLFLSSCDNREDIWFESLVVKENTQFQLKRLNEAGIIDLSKSDGFIDSIKKDYSEIYSYTIISEKNLDISITNDKTKAEVIVDEEQKTIEYTPLSKGAYEVDIILSDQYQNELFYTLPFYCYEKINPVAKSSILKNLAIDPLYFKIDASASYDRDEKYGGEIATYEFLVLGTEINIKTDQPVYDQILPDAGTYTFLTRVCDNEDLFSYYDTVYMVFP